MRRFPAAHLEAFIARALAAVGLPEADAREVAVLMTRADLRGAEGRPLTDPKRADEGFLLPIGGYKGYGLALVFGLLAGTLNGAAMGGDVVDFNRDDVTPTNTGHVIVALDVAHFSPVDEFKRRVDAMIHDIRGSKRLPGVERIRLPGEQSHAAFLERSREGLPLNDALPQLTRLAADLGIAPLG